MKPMRVFLLIVGVLVGLVGLALLTGGGTALWATTERDADGYWSTDPEPLVSPSYAIVSEPLALTIGEAEWIPKDIATLRITVDRPEDHFLGVAATRDVNRYLADVAYTRVTDLESDPVRVISHEISGSGAPGNPRAEDLWVATAQDGTLTWDVRGGRWSIVVMNDDASQGVDATVTVGIATGLLLPVGIAMLVVGALLTIGAVVLIVSSVRHRTARHLAPGETPARPDITP